VASLLGMKTLSVTQAWRCTWRLSAEPKRCRKDTAPSRGREALGASASWMTPEAVSRDRSISVRKIFVRAATALGPVGEESAQSLGDGNHPLPHGHRRDDVIHEMGGCLRHPPAVAGRAHASALVGKRDQKGVATPRAPGPGKPVAHDPAAEIRAELVFDVPCDGLVPRLPVGEA